MNKLVGICFVTLGLSFCAYGQDDNSYSEYVTDNSVSFENADGTASAELTILDPIVNIPTTKDYAQHLMDSYQGWDLNAIVDLRGFSFKYVDNGPCAGLLTYYDGRSYLFFKACGLISSDELVSLFKKANEKLKISESLKRQSKANL